MNKTREIPPTLIGWETMHDRCTLHCPKCGFDYNHALAAYTLTGTNDPKYIIPGTFSGGQSGRRGAALAIEFSCENGHEWRLIFLEDKGHVHLEYDNEQIARRNTEDGK